MTAEAPAARRWTTKPGYETREAAYEGIADRARNDGSGQFRDDEDYDAVAERYLEFWEGDIALPEEIVNQ